MHRPLETVSWYSLGKGIGPVVLGLSDQFDGGFLAMAAISSEISGTVAASDGTFFSGGAELLVVKDKSVFARDSIA